MTGEKLKRRRFIQICGGAAIATSLQLAPISLFARSSQNKRNNRFKLNKPQWVVYENGTFNLIGKEIILKNCRPSIEGQTVMPKNVFLGDSPKGKRIVYELPGGFLMLDLKSNKDSISISPEFSGFSRAPRWFYPISQAQIFGVNSCFLQGFGTNGQSRIVHFEPGSPLHDSKNWSYDSYLAFAFLGQTETIAIGQTNHNDFFHRSSIYNRTHHEGINQTKLTGEQFFFESGMLLEEIKIKNEYILLPEVHFYGGNMPFETLQELAWKTNEETAARPSSVTSFHWFSARGTTQNNSFDNLRKQVEFLKIQQPKIPVHTLAINRGYCIDGDWLEPNENWPGGLDKAAREIFKEGYRAGIWIAPFRVSDRSQIFKKRRNWLIKDYNNEIFPEEIGENESFYALDISNPDVKKHIGKIFNSLRKMGFIFFETGHLDYGFKDSIDVKRDEKGKTSVQVFREMCEIIREEIGAGSLWMADQTPYSPLIGFADIVRVSSKQNTPTGILAENDRAGESWFSHYFNNIYWQNSLCEIELTNSENQVLRDMENSLALWTGMLGGAVGISADFSTLNDEQLKLSRFLVPSKQQKNANLPFWPGYDEIKIALRFYQKQESWSVLFFNDTADEVSKTFSIDDLIGTDSAYIFEWGKDYSLAFGNLSEIIVNLRPGESKLFYLSEKDVPPSENMTLGGVELEDQ